MRTGFVFIHYHISTILEKNGNVHTIIIPDYMYDKDNIGSAFATPELAYQAAKDYEVPKELRGKMIKNSTIEVIQIWY